MALITKSSIQEVNDRLDAVSVIGDYISLQKKSGRWWGKCPFHAGGHEKTPSFKVDPDLKTYHCFGCNKGGSVISFVMEMDSLTYPEAIKVLAQKMGIELVYEKNYGFTDNKNEIEDKTFKEQMYELYSRTAVTFSHFLKEKQEGKAALNYLAQRGVSREMIDVFNLGYAPADRNFLHKFLKQKGYSDEFLEKSGLFSKNYKNYPLFSARLIFPISDKQGKIVGFGGRIIPLNIQNDLETSSQAPKYINSPETEIYKKGQTLYAINLAKNEMRKTKKAVIAEGNIDVIALHQAGVTNAVAPLGTAFTDEQAKWLSLWVEKAVLVFDNDEAGQKAAFKAILSCRKHGISCSIVDLKEKDPADFLQKFGQNALKNAMDSTIFDFEYLLNLTEDKSGISLRLFPYLDALNSEIERDDCVSSIADFFRIEKTAVQKDYERWKTKHLVSDYASNAKPLQEGMSIRRSFELIMLTVAATNMELYSELRCDVEIKEIADPAAKELFIALEECYAAGEKGIDLLLARIENESLRSFIASNGSSPEFRGNNARRLIEDGKKEIRKKRILKRLTEIGIEIRQLEKNQDKENAIDELLLEKKHLDEQIRNL